MSIKQKMTKPGKTGVTAVIVPVTLQDIVAIGANSHLIVCTHANKGSNGARMEAHAQACTSVSVDWTPASLCTSFPWPGAGTRAQAQPITRRHTDIWKIIYRETL